MKIYHEKAIDLKYQGYTYKYISKAINYKISEPVLRRYFSIEGMLYVPYLEYEARQNHWNEQNAKNEYMRMAAYTAKIIKDILKQALVRHDLRLALSIVKYIDDMAGIGITREKIKEERNRFETYEDFLAECKRVGIDPKTGFRLQVKNLRNKN